MAGWFYCLKSGLGLFVPEMMLSGSLFCISGYLKTERLSVCLAGLAARLIVRTHQAQDFVPHAVWPLFGYGGESSGLLCQFGGGKGLLDTDAGRGEIGEAGQPAEALLGQGVVLQPMLQVEAAPAERVKRFAAEGAVWGETDAAYDAGGTQLAVCFQVASNL